MFPLKQILGYSREELSQALSQYDIPVTSDTSKPELQVTLIDYLTENNLIIDSKADSLENKANSTLSLDIEMRKLEIEARQREQEFEAREKDKMKEFEAREKDKMREFEAREKDKMREFELRKLELNLQNPINSSTTSTNSFSYNSASPLLPPFNENEVENFFDIFEKLAASNNWPVNEYVNIITTKLSSKARNAILSLPVEEINDYMLVKTKILETFHVTAEKLRLNFRNLTKKNDESYLEYINKKKHKFDKWLREANVTTYEDLKHLILTEELFSQLPHELHVYFVDKTNNDYIEMAKLADAYALRIKPNKFPFKHNVVHNKQNTFLTKRPVTSNPRNFPNTNHNPNLPRKEFKRPIPNTSPNSSSSPNYNERFCTYCKSYGHTIDFCFKRQNNYRFTSGTAQSAEAYFQSRQNSSKNVSSNPTTDKINIPNMPTLPNTNKPENPTPTTMGEASLNISIPATININNKVSPQKFNNFIFDCTCQPLDKSKPNIPILSLRDTGCSVSLLKKGILPDDYLKDLDCYILINGVISSQSVPLYSFLLHSPFGIQT